MTEKAILYLKEHGIESFELMGVLVIPVSNPEELDIQASKISKLLKECGYDKSWSLDPYYYERHKSLEGEMFQ